MKDGHKKLLCKIIYEYRDNNHKTMSKEEYFDLLYIFDVLIVNFDLDWREYESDKATNDN